VKLLVVDDDTLIADFVRLALKEDGHSVDVAHTGAEGRTLALVHDYDVVVMDYVLPDGSGVDVVRDIRARGRATPVLMLTGRTGKDDVIRGLDAGADDYLVKPFVVGELLARIRALGRRAGAARADDARAFGGVAVDRLRRTITADGRKLSLTPKEYTLLEYFLLNPDRVVTRSELLEKVWEMQFDPGSNVIDVHVARLRSKLQRAAPGVSLATVRGAGFILTRSGDGG
jgi:DNA-binding response OmpR family regulator